MLNLIHILDEGVPGISVFHLSQDNAVVHIADVLQGDGIDLWIVRRVDVILLTRWLDFAGLLALELVAHVVIGLTRDLDGGFVGDALLLRTPAGEGDEQNGEGEAQDVPILDATRHGALRCMFS